MTRVPESGGVEKGFTPVSLDRQCPICKKTDWCLIANDGTAAICPRTEAGSVKRCGDAGWLHKLADPTPEPPIRKSKPSGSRDWPAEASRFAGMLTADDRDWLCRRLGLPPGGLDSIPLLGSSGRRSDGPITTWPEMNAAGVVIGVNERTPGPTKDAKKMRAGGKRGLTLPTGWQDQSGPVFVVEGPTDAAAMTAAGLCGVGRPSKDGGVKLLTDLFADWPADRQIVVLGENDPPDAAGTLPGRDAAVRVARGLAVALRRPVHWALPPADAKDVRTWLTHPDRGELPWADRGAELSEKLLAGATVVNPPPGPSDGVSGGSGRPADSRPEIVVSTEEHRVNAEATAALASESDIYQRGGLLVHVLEQDAESDPAEVIRRPAGSPVVRELAKPLLRERLTRCARWVEVRANDEGTYTIPVHPPGWAVDAVHVRGRWPHVRRLEAVVTHPVVLPNGTVLAEDGYHRKSGILVSLPSDLSVPVPDAPTRADVRSAVDVLLDPLADFPFETPAHRAALVAGLLTPLAWFAFTGPAPLFLIDKNVRGAGAGLLADVVAIILTGQRFPVMTYTNDREELRKRITTATVEGERLLLLDNLTGAVGNEILDAALTTDRWKDRLLGGNRMFDGPLHVTWWGTGNNVQLAADTSRRVCHIRMESAYERPEMREGFKYRDLRAHVRANRGVLLSAALTILRGWFAAGKPTHGLRPWGSYEPWSDVVREAVVFAGLPDPGETRIALQTVADRDAAAMGDLIAGWARMDDTGRGLTASEVVGRLREADPAPDWMTDMRAAVEDLCGKLDGRALGYKLRHFQRRNFGGRMIDKAGTDGTKTNRWVVVDVRPGLRPVPSPSSPGDPEGEPGDAGDEGDAPARSAAAPRPRSDPSPDRPAWEDWEQFHALLIRTGWTWPDVLKWMNASPTAGFYDVPVGRRMAVVEHLDRLAVGGAAHRTP